MKQQRKIQSAATPPLALTARVIASALDRRAIGAALLGLGALVLGAACAALAAAAFAFAVSAQSAGAGLGHLCAAALLGAGAQALEVTKWRLHARAEQALERALTEKVFTAALKTKAGASVGAQMQALADALVGCRLLFQHGVFTAQSAVMGALAAALVIAAIGHAGLALVIVLFAPTYIAASLITARRLTAASARVAALRLKAAGRFGDGFVNREAINLFAAQDFLAAGLRRALAAAERVSNLLSGLRSRASLAAVAIFAATLLASFWLAWSGANDESARVRAIVLAQVSLMSLLAPLELCAQAVRDLIWARALAAPLGALMETSEPMPMPMPRRDGEGGAVVELDAVTFAYPGRSPVLREARLVVGRGEFVGVLGESGAGKSTLLRLVSGALVPQSGRIRFGASANSCPRIAAALQEPLLVDDTIAANIAFGRSCNSEEMENAIACAGLERLIASLPQGLNTRVGERGALLSGGERQRVALARALLKPASLYLLDEASSALDPEAEQEVMARVAKAVRGVSSLLVIAHRASALAGADRIVALRDVVFVEIGARRH